MKIDWVIVMVMTIVFGGEIVQVFEKYLDHQVQIAKISCNK